MGTTQYYVTRETRDIQGIWQLEESFPLIGSYYFVIINRFTHNLLCSHSTSAFASLSILASACYLSKEKSWTLMG
jgi:hypothetical protein